MNRGRLTSVAVLGASFAVAAGGTAMVNAAVDSGSAAPQRTQQVDARLSAHFGALRQGVSSDASARQSQADATMADTGVNPDLGRTTAAYAGDVALITPSSGGLCVGTKNLGILTCGDASSALKGEVIGAIICSKQVPVDKVEILGTFPDEVTSVVASMSDGSTSTLPIAANTLIRQFAKDAPVPLTLSFTAHGMAQRVTTSLPKDGDLGCGPGTSGA